MHLKLHMQYNSNSINKHSYGEKRQELFLILYIRIVGFGAIFSPTFSSIFPVV